MNVLGLLSYTAVGMPVEDMSEFEELEQAFYQSFDDLADGFFTGVAENIGEALKLGAENPLCVVLAGAWSFVVLGSCLIVVLTFHIVPPLLRVFLDRF